MTELRHSKTLFNVLCVATALMLIANIYLISSLYEEIVGFDANAVTALVEAESLQLSPELRSTFENKGIVSVALFTEKNEILSYVIDGGKSIDLCHGYGEGSATLKSCKLDISIAALMDDMVITEPPIQTTDRGGVSDSQRSAVDVVIPTATASSHRSCGRCPNAAGTLKACHTGGTYADKFADSCHAGTHWWCANNTICY